MTARAKEILQQIAVGAFSVTCATLLVAHCSQSAHAAIESESHFLTVVEPQCSILIVSDAGEVKTQCTEAQLHAFIAKNERGQLDRAYAQVALEILRLRAAAAACRQSAVPSLSKSDRIDTAPREHWYEYMLPAPEVAPQQ